MDELVTKYDVVVNPFWPDILTKATTLNSFVPKTTSRRIYLRRERTLIS